MVSPERITEHDQLVIDLFIHPDKSSRFWTTKTRAGIFWYFYIEIEILEVPVFFELLADIYINNRTQLTSGGILLYLDVVFAADQSKMIG